MIAFVMHQVKTDMVSSFSLVKFKGDSKKKFTHNGASKVHFHRRFRERVGYALSENGYEEILELVKAEGKFLYRRPNEIGAVFFLRFKGLPLKVVYDGFSNKLITLLSV